MLNPDVKLAEKVLGEVEQIPARNGYGEGLVDAGETNPQVVALCCDLSGSTKTAGFQKKFPERFIELGIQEQNMAGVGAGMSFEGKVPYISSYAAFSPGRNWDQIRVSICYSKANVKIMGAHAGISVGPDGATHQAMEDIAITRCLPNMTVIVPCDYWEARKATRAMADLEGPVYMRFGRENVPVVTTEETPFEIGKAQTYRQGTDVTVMACGPLVYEALIAAEELQKEGVSVRVMNVATIKPIDKDAIVQAAEETGAVVTAEEHQVHGGFGSAVAEVLAWHKPVPVEFVAVMDRFGESGQPQELMAKFGVKSPNIVHAVKEVLKRK